MHGMYTAYYTACACTLHITACRLHCALHVHVHVHCMCTACARHVHGMCTACALHVHGMCTARTLHVHHCIAHCIPYARQVASPLAKESGAPGQSGALRGLVIDSQGCEHVAVPLALTTSSLATLTTYVL